MKTSNTIIALLLLGALSQEAYSACRVYGNAGIRPDQPNVPGRGYVVPVLPGGGNEYIWDDSEIEPHWGSSMGSPIASAQGTDIVYNGKPTAGGAFYGIYPTIEGSAAEIQASMLVSIDWKPDGREVCTNHKTEWNGKRKCVQKGIEYYPTSFVVDLTTEVGKYRHYVHQFTNVNSANRVWIDMPALNCDGPIIQFEARIMDLNGGTVNFKVHQIDYRKFWRY